MADPRVERLAAVLVRYSLGLQAGQLLRINAPATAAALVRAVAREATLVGAHVLPRITIDGLDEIALRLGSDEQLSYVSPLALQEIETVDATLTIWADSNTKALSSVDPRKATLQQQARRPILTRFLERAAAGDLHWCGTLFPTQAHAQDAEMSLTEYEDFVYGAGLLNEPDPVAAWRAVSARQARLIDRLTVARHVRVVAPGTDLTVGVAGRTWINADGAKNFPDGEVFTGPVEDSAEGHISFSFPAVHLGREVDGIRLEFAQGKVVKATATKGQDLLTSLLDMDAGARYLGEFAFGTNEGIQRHTRNTLFDEKIGGTMHLAVGASYPDTGGTNQSALHWDIVCDLRHGGEVYADGALIARDGQFLYE
ncbi:MAG: aminopeptidase [Chloroflexi bacterium]|nr:aminopeptidase [Chloroflexota bacterium]